IGEFGQAEIEVFSMPIGPQNDVFRLDVQMNDSGLMGGLQRAGRLYYHIQRLVDRYPTIGQPLPDGIALYELHRDVVEAGFFADVINRDDVGMVQGGSSTGFLPEAAHSFVVTGEFCAEHLERDFTVEFCVAGQVYVAHPSGSDVSDYAVWAKALNLGEAKRIRRFQRSRDGERRGIHEAAGLFVSDQERAYFLAQLGIVHASFLEEQ